MLETLKILLGMTNNDNDTVLRFIIDDVTESVLNYCGIDTLPEGLENTVIRMCVDVYRNEQFGQDAAPVIATSVTAGDTSTSFSQTSAAVMGYPESILKDYHKQLNRYRKVVF